MTAKNWWTSSSTGVRVSILILTMTWVGITSITFARPDRAFILIPEHFRMWAVLLSKGQLPWIDFKGEYPPLGMLLSAYPGILGTHRTAASWVLTASTVSLVTTLGGVYYVWRKRVAEPNKRQFFLLISALMLILALQKLTWLLWNDTIPVVACLVFGISVLRASSRLTAFTAAFALTSFALAKGYLLLMVILLFALSYEKKSSRFMFSSLGASTSLFGFSALVAMRFDMLTNFISYHQIRGIEVGSIYVPFVTLFVREPLATRYVSGSFDLVYQLPGLALLSFLPALIYTLFITILLARLGKSAQSMKPEIYAIASCGTLALFFGFNKVGSANYILVPTLLLIGVFPAHPVIRNRAWWLLALALSMALGSRYSIGTWKPTADILSEGFLSVFAVFVKNIGLIATALLCFQILRELQSHEGGANVLGSNETNRRTGYYPEQKERNSSAPNAS